MRKRYLLGGELLFLVGIPLLMSKNYLTFHVTVEFLCAAVALFASYVIQRNEQLRARSFYKVLSATMISVAIIDLFHLFTYRGMGVFPVDEENIATQFWLVGRYLLAFGLLSGTLLSGRNLRYSFVLSFFLLMTGVAIFAVFTGVFPESYILGTGLTQFKIISEYLIIGLLLFTILLLTNHQVTFCMKGHLLLIAVIGMTVLSELMFTLYQDVYGLFNATGHILKMAAYMTLFHLFSLYDNADEK
jgi:hypothetical protein